VRQAKKCEVVEDKTERQKGGSIGNGAARMKLAGQLPQIAGQKCEQDCQESIAELRTSDKCIVEVHRLNDRGQAGRAYDEQLQTEALSRPCLQQEC
jgi:hypothetical protein